MNPLDIWFLWAYLGAHIFTLSVSKKGGFRRANWAYLGAHICTVPADPVKTQIGRVPAIGPLMGIRHCLLPVIHTKHPCFLNSLYYARPQRMFTYCEAKSNTAERDLPHFSAPGSPMGGSVHIHAELSKNHYKKKRQNPKGSAFSL